MKVARILIPLLLLFIAFPTFAACTDCDISCVCVISPGSGLKCKPTRDCCTVVTASCLTAANAATPSLVSAYRVASVEVVTPKTRSVATTDVRTAQAQPVAAPHTR